MSSDGCIARNSGSRGMIISRANVVAAETLSRPTVRRRRHALPALLRQPPGWQDSGALVEAQARVSRGEGVR